MKNECPYILEWIAYHLSIGFTHFVVATNGCADGTVRLLRNLERAGIVTHVDNPPPHGRGPQKTGYFRCRHSEMMKNADWLMTLDVDEFVNIHVGDGTLDALFDAAPDANMISFQWLMFGHNGQIAFEDRPVIEQFTRSAHPLQILPTILRSFKTLYRGGLYQRLGTHRPIQIMEGARDRIHWVDGSGRPMPEAYIDRGWAGGLMGEGLGIRLGRINHYAVRSMESFMIKRDRGDVNPNRDHVKTQGSGVEYWKMHDWNLTEDETILRHLPATHEKIRELCALPRVARVHQIGVEWHKTRAGELAEREDMAELCAHLIAHSARGAVLDPGALRPPEGA